MFEAFFRAVILNIFSGPPDPSFFGSKKYVKNVGSGGPEKMLGMTTVFLERYVSGFFLERCM